MTKQLKWRLPSLPQPDELRQLVSDGIMTKDEARDVLFSQVDAKEEREKDSLKEEIKFLRELVKSLSNNSRTEIIKTIEYVEKPYKKYDWYEPYKWYCTTSDLSSGTSGVMYLTADTTSGNTLTVSNSANVDFTSIKTF